MNFLVGLEKPIEENDLDEEVAAYGNDYNDDLPFVPPEPEVNRQEAFLPVTN